MVIFLHPAWSRESRPQMLERTGALPDAVVACAGGGSNAIGTFAEYLLGMEDGEQYAGNDNVRLIGVEPAGEGLDTDKHGAPLNKGVVGILHGSCSYALLKDGEILHPHSVSAGLDYPGIGPEHSYLKDTGRAAYPAVTDAEALDAFRMLSRYEGIIPALESSHALAFALKLAQQCEETGEEMNILVTLSGRGDKDVDYVRRIQGDLAAEDPATHPVVNLNIEGVLAEMTAESNAREGL